MSIYSSLDSSRNQIRVLHLSSGRENDDELYCTLSTVSLDDDPQYEALSYVWGDISEDEPSIMLGEREVKVRRNLHSALKAIRHLDHERVVWIDALCINQTDSVEVKSKLSNNSIQHPLIMCVAQIAIMGDIYSKAGRVLAYIGEKFDGCDRLMDIMSYVSDNYKVHFDGPEDTVLKINGVPIMKGGIPWNLVYQFFETTW
jgi:hypothetical protein